MNCIFCKRDSEKSNNIEHIIPLSLGNTDHVLPRGVVCDSCNNYFGRKIEKPILDSPMIRLLRFDRKIPNRENRLPFFTDDEYPALPDFRLMSRFLAKIALETLAFRTLNIACSNDEIVYKKELDEIRNYARYNLGEFWPFSYRTIYAVNSVFKENSEYFEVLHEFDLLYLDNKELYLILAILGVEFAINFSGRRFESYYEWLEKNNGISPLYFKKLNN